MEKPGPGEKEKQVRALRERRFVKHHFRGPRGAKDEVSEIEMLRAEVKRLKRELAKAHGRAR